MWNNNVQKGQDFAENQQKAVFFCDADYLKNTYDD